MKINRISCKVKNHTDTQIENVILCFSMRQHLKMQVIQNEE